MVGARSRYLRMRPLELRAKGNLENSLNIANQPDFDPNTVERMLISQDDPPTCSIGCVSSARHESQTALVRPSAVEGPIRTEVADLQKSEENCALSSDLFRR